MTAIGDAVIRVDGPEKVTGKAKFAAEFSPDKVACGVLVTSTIGNGTLLRIDLAAAQGAPGVVTIMTPFNAPKLPDGGKAAVKPPAGRVLSLLQDDQVHYNNQPIAVVVADTLNQAIYAASLLQIRYKPSPPVLDFKAGFPTAHPGGHGKDPADVGKGSIDDALHSAEVTVDEIYTTPMQNHNPMETHATVASWEGENLTLHDSTQYVSGVKQTVAKTLGLPNDNVRVICPFTGGGFGSKGSTWSHVVLAAMAAKVAQRPVKIVLERPQMFGPVGGRPETYQHVTLGAKRDGTLVGLRHDCYSHTSVMEDFTEPSSTVSRVLYASSAISTKQRLVPLNVGVPTFQRAPGEATGTFALEIAMDELAEKLQMDPIALRMKNYAQKDPTSDKPFSSKHLEECYTQGAQRFGWAKRPSGMRATREGHELIGYGMATATYPANRSAAMAMVTFQPSGRVLVASGSQDLGTGTYTIMAQVAAATLDMDIAQVDAKLGDTTLPKAPVSGGSQSAASVTPAVADGAKQARLKLFALASETAGSSLSGAAMDDMQLKAGVVSLKSAPGKTATVVSLLQLAGGKPVGAMGSAQPDESSEQYSAHSFGAVFAEVAVDETLGMPRVRRVVAVYDIGTLLSGKTGTSQLIGGVVWGVSLALQESTHLDPTTGRPVNNNLAEYHVPVNLDIGEIDIVTLGIPDMKLDPLGARGVGEIGITGTAAAVANAIYHATGKRIREAPITPDKLIA